MKKFQHIMFKKHWKLTENCLYQLGQSKALIEAISNTPLKPEYQNRLLQLALVKGAQATTAIEGNTLSEEEIIKVQQGEKLPPSKEYQEIEVRNIINAFNVLLKEIVEDNEVRLITPDLIKRLHQMIGQGLGEHFDAIPGKFRKDSRIVGTYRTPDYREVPSLVDNLCQWLKKEFHYSEDQRFIDSVVQAIVTHVYIEWIHPFGDGNGRTGRLAEFYILLRAGLPSIVSHILSNFYNLTRPEYYRQLKKATEKQDLTEFIEYAVQGFRDGLNENLEIIQGNHFIIFWHNYIYETFAKVKITKKEAFKRKRELMLSIPPKGEFTANEIVMVSPEVARRYSSVTTATIKRDLEELVGLQLLEKNEKTYRANIRILHTMIPQKKIKKNINDEI